MFAAIGESMAVRNTVCDYAGDELYAGDLIAYASRQGNRVRMTDAIILRVTTRNEGGRLIPMLLVEPSGIESGFVKRRSLRAEWIGAEHVRLIVGDYVSE